MFIFIGLIVIGLIVIGCIVMGLIVPIILTFITAFGYAIVGSDVVEIVGVEDGLVDGEVVLSLYLIDIVIGSIVLGLIVIRGFILVLIVGEDG